MISNSDIRCMQQKHISNTPQWLSWNVLRCSANCSHPVVWSPAMTDLPKWQQHDEKPTLEHSWLRHLWNWLILPEFQAHPKQNSPHQCKLPSLDFTVLTSYQVPSHLHINNYGNNNCTYLPSRILFCYYNSDPMHPLLWKTQIELKSDKSLGFCSDSS